MMAPPAYTESRLRAKYHVQVGIESRDMDRTPALVPVCCRVRRVFRGDDRLHVGDPVRFSIAVCRDGEDIPEGGDLWMSYEDFQNAEYLEAFLDGIPPDCEAARSQRFVIARLSNDPQIAVPTEKEVAAAWTAFHSAGRRFRMRRETRSWMKTWTTANYLLLAGLILFVLWTTFREAMGF
jgi:hypothetical protein